MEQENCQLLRGLLKSSVRGTGRCRSQRIYRRFDSGQIVNVAGLDLPIDEPEVPDLLAEFETSQTAVMVADNWMKILNKEN